MSPIYCFSCCGHEVEVMQGIDEDTPLCPDCRAVMHKLPTTPAIITIKGKDGLRSYSEGYKEGYSKDYLRRLEEAKS